MSEKEIWKDVEGYEEFYQISNFGEVRSKDRWRNNGSKSRYLLKSKTMTKSKTTTGYWKIGFFKDGKRREFKIHRLVAFAFIPNPENKPNINHKDGNPLNNHISNLEWCTQSENLQHAYETGLRKTNFHKYLNEITREYLEEEKTSIWDLARKYKCSHFSITKYFNKNGIKIKSSSSVRDVYNVNRKELIKDFKSGLSNKEIAKKHYTNNVLIATYRYKFKKGELKL